jgi:uncharacterized membrane protein
VGRCPHGDLVGPQGQRRPLRRHADAQPDFDRRSAVGARRGLRRLPGVPQRRDRALHHLSAIIYPLAGCLLWRFASGYSLPQLIFPLIAGFALVGPLFATGLYEMSRRHEAGEPVTWGTAFAAFRSPGIGAIFTLGIGLLAVLLVWLVTAELIYLATLGPGVPVSFAAFTHDVLFTARGRLMTIIGIDVGLLFAILVLCTTAIAFPLLLDRRASAAQAIRASIRAVQTNPREMAIWGALVAGLLVLGSLPLLVGLIVVVPLLGHATWHLYRKLMPV